MKNLKLFSILSLALALSFTACKDEDTEISYETDPNSLYSRLGGFDAISAVTDQFLANVAGDAVINARFAATVADPFRLEVLRNNLIDQICEGAGGPCKYKGETMAKAHEGMDISQEEFNALVGDLVAALDQFNVPEQEKNDLLAILGPMQTDIVGK
ncbi:MAG: group 1 truncated hemoglobin [Saprospiraceae bacterium]|nr:group 1 truncated hemoglobin [Saprospiraceae bacterium]